MAQVIQFSGAGAKAPADMVPGQFTTAIVFQFPRRQSPATKRGVTDASVTEYMEKWQAKRDEQSRFGRRLAVVRAVLGLSIEDAALAAGIKPLSFKHYESGTTEMRTGRFLAFVQSVRGVNEFLLSWLLEDGPGHDKAAKIIAYCRDAGIAGNGIVNAIVHLHRSGDDD